MKKGVVILAVVLTIAILVGGCVKVTAPVNTQTTDDVETNNDGTAEPETTLQKCEEAINYQVLIDALPTSVNGFVAGEPEGNMLTFNDPTSQNTMKYSTANVRLEKDDKSIDVTLMDTCYIQFLSMAWLGYYEMEGTDGFYKKTTIEGFPGWHQYDKSSERYSFNIFVKDRVIVTVQGDNDVPDADVEAAAKAIGYSAIVSAAK